MPDAVEWMLLIYALPSQPTRKRAYVWRELKRLGAVYLRDGVAILPRRQRLEEVLQALAARILEYEGSVDLVLSPQFAQPRDAELAARFREERTQEYRELYHASARFLRDVLEEVDSQEFGFPDVGNLESELGRLHRWHEQIAERDYFNAPDSARVSEILVKCDRAFERFVEEAHERSGAETRPAREDAFERLGEGAGVGEKVPEDYPL